MNHKSTDQSPPFSFCIFNGCLTFYVIAQGSDAEKHFLTDYV